MAEFCVYRYDFIPCGDFGFRPKGEEYENCEWHEAQRRYMSNRLRRSNTLPLKKVISKKESFILNSRMLRADEDIFLLRVPNRKVVKIYTETQDDPTPEESRPQCYVIIDNRPNYKHVYIEKNEAFNKNVQHAMVMLSLAVEEMLQECNCFLKIRPKVFTKGMWQRIEFEESQGHPITKFTVEILESKQMQVGEDKDEKEAADLIRSQLKWNQTFGNAQSKFETMLNTESDFKLAKKGQVAGKILELLVRNDYETRIEFKGSQPYVSSEEALAFFKIPDVIITDFREGNSEKGENTLYSVLEEINRENDRFIFKETPIDIHGQKRSRKNNKEVVE